MNEVDLIIHYMRQSKMDEVRKHLEYLVKDSKKQNETLREPAKDCLRFLTSFFKATSNDAPLP